MHDSLDDMASSLDLAAYLARIGQAAPGAPDAALLRALHRAHATRIPFENLDLMLGRPISVELADIEAKLVRARRGGYCFEQNLLFGTALRALGYAPRPLLARVRVDGLRVLPRTHMVLVLEADGERVIADVGFGAGGLLKPVPLDPPGEVAIGHWAWRIVREGELHVMQSARAGVWRDLYAFTLEPQLPVDIAVANHYVSTHPDSRFLQILTAQRLSPQARYTLRNRELTVDRGDAQETRTLASREEVLRVLAHDFGLALPVDAPLRVPG
jgi:N-hydroxyarylamine O-acetyltransferase